MTELVIRRATIVDGSGAKGWVGDIAVEADHIVEVSPSIREKGAREIDADGLVASPGFIDMHSHSDLVLPDCPGAENMISQGITTEVVGQCGFSPAPVPSAAEQEFYASVGFFRVASEPWPWRTFAQYLSHLDLAHTSTNVVPLVGHGPVRASAMGFANRKPTPLELNTMIEHLGEAFEAGAWGLSTGLVYPPGCFAEAEELTALAKVVAKHRRLYCTHVRGEGDTLIESIEEAISVAEGAGAALQISHFKASGERNWPKQATAIKMIEGAKARNLDVMVDVMSTSASGTTLSSLLPDWIKEGGPKAMQAKLNEPESRARVKRDIVEGLDGWSNVFAAVGLDKFFVFGAPSLQGNHEWSIAQIARERGEEPVDTLLNILAADGADVFTVFLTMSDKNVLTALTHPLAVVGSDGWAHPPLGTCMCSRMPHPRSFGTYPKLFGEIVRDKSAMTLEEAVHKSTGAPARRLGLFDRGRLVGGCKADIVLFDAKRIRDRTSIAMPSQSPEGVEYVIVNGTVCVSPGKLETARAGRVLRKRGVRRE